MGNLGIGKIFRFHDFMNDFFSQNGQIFASAPTEQKRPKTRAYSSLKKHEKSTKMGLSLLSFSF